MSISDCSSNSPAADSTENQTTEREFFEFAIERAEFEHDQLTDTWKLIDTKAQGTTAIAGIFLAAVFVFVRNTNLKLTGSEQILLAVVLISSLTAIVVSVWCMLVKEVRAPLTGDDAVSMVRNILETDERERTERYDRLLGDTLRKWLAANEDVRSVTSTKARDLHIGQSFLLTSAIAIALLACVAIFSK